MPRRCSYEYRKDKIHELRLLESSEAAVDQLLSYLDRIGMTEDQAVLLLDFTQSGLPPVNYFISRLNEWQQARPNLALGRRAVLYRGTGMTHALLQHITALLDFFQPSHTQFFQMQHAEAARNWLRQTPIAARVS
jgi:hypothetical protein